jgi:hypothetical protein
MKLDFKFSRRGIGRWFLVFGLIFGIGLFLKFVVEPNITGIDLSTFQTVGWVIFGTGLAGLILGLIVVIMLVTVV